MNMFLKKEIRLLLPSWVISLLLALSFWLLPRDSNSNFGITRNLLALPFFFCPILLMVTIIKSFRHEISLRTFSLLLAQPISRVRIWRTKTMLLAVAVLLVWLTWCLSCACYNPTITGTKPWRDLWVASGLFAFTLYSGGLWAALLFRQIAAAFWFTILTPFLLAMVVGLFLRNYSESIQNEALFVAFILYSIAGFFWARRMFLRAQDTQWTGGEISFSWRKKSLTQAATSFPSQPYHWFSALVRKEFQLHQVTILIAALVLALHLSSIFIRKIHPTFENQNVKFLLEFVWALWLLMPLLIGSAAVAEERRLGVIESQLFLPVSRRAQLFIKFSAGLILSLFLGAMMPLLIENPKDFATLTHFALSIFAIAAVVFFISFYASTLARTTLQAIGLAIVITIAIYFYQVATAINVLKFGYAYEEIGLELLKGFLNVPILFFILGALMIWNFKWLHENWKFWRWNLFIVLAAFAFVFILTNVIYFRAWEFLKPIEPSHETPRLNSSTEIKLRVGSKYFFRSAAGWTALDQNAGL
jgi:hypothetical protein